MVLNVVSIMEFFPEEWVMNDDIKQSNNFLFFSRISFTMMQVVSNLVSSQWLVLILSCQQLGIGGLPGLIFTF